MRFTQVGVGRTAAAALTVTVFFLTAAVFRPEPVSDFLYYWMVAGAPDLYHKGGVVGWLFAPVKAADIAPYWGAAALNTFVAILAIFAVLPAGGKRNSSIGLVSWIGAAVTVLAILVGAPASALVATDLMACGAFIVGMRLLLRGGGLPPRRLAVLAAVMALGLSASLRPIYAPVMIVCGAALMAIQRDIRVLDLPADRWTGRLRAAGFGALLVCCALLASNLLERGLLSHSRTNEYAPGVVRAVVSIGHDIGDGKDTCGQWSESRARFGLERRSEPLIPYILERQREVGWLHLPALYACKVSRLIGFRDWFGSWLQGSRNYSQDRILADSMGVDVALVDEAARQSHVFRSDAAQQAYTERARLVSRVSAWIGGILQGLVLLYLLASTVALARERSIAFGLYALGVSLLPAVALIVLHGVFFEVQARYAFPIWVLPPVFMALIRRVSNSASSAAAAAGPAAPDVV